MYSIRYDIEPLRYNSNCVSFPEWISLLTLCLAPLIAHIASGTPQVSYLAHNRPKWYDRLCHYNPTSIIWRYAAITDRRIRATRWSRTDLAASNAILWTTKGWDGSEKIVSAAVPHCVRYPETTHVEILSVTMLKTIITTLQGISALYSLIGGLAGRTDTNFVAYMGVDMIFFPLAVLGLLRLCAATWLTEDFEFALRNDALSSVLSQKSPGLTINDREFQFMEPSESLDPFLIAPFQSSGRFSSPNSSWRSRFFRAFFLLIFGGVWALAFVYLMPGVRSTWLQFTVTAFLVGLFFLVFLTVSLILYTFYFFKGQTTTTILPCISKTWFRIYTLLVMGLMFLLIVVASIETNKMPNGMYTSQPMLEEVACSSLATGWWSFVPNSTFSGLVSRVERNSTWLGQNYSSVPVIRTSGNMSTLEDRYWIYNFTGYCIGQVENTTTA